MPNALINLLENEYKPGRPIFAEDIDMNSSALRVTLKRLVDNGVLKRFEPGVYYIPGEGLLGELSPSIEEVAYEKYIIRKGKRMGYYSGYTLANIMHLSSQVPMVKEITTNNAKTPIREICILDRKFTLRKPITEITDENVYTLIFLDCLLNYEKFCDIDMGKKEISEILSKFVVDNDITKSDVDKYITLYPEKVYKSIYELEVEHVFT